MSLWREINSRPEYQTQVLEYYNNFNLTNIRNYLARWIEDVIMINKINMNEVEFYEQIKNKLANCIDMILQINIQPVNVYNRIKLGIEMEINLLKTLPFEIKRLQTILNNTNQLNQSIMSLINERKQLNLLINNFSSQQPTQQSNLLREDLEKNYNNLHKIESTLISDLKSIYFEYNNIQHVIINQELKRWQKNQAYAGNGEYFIDNLDAIQMSIELLVKIICNIIACIEQLILSKNANTADENTNTLTEIVQHARNAQKHLVFSAFIVEKQPPQVMKKLSKFSVTVRWLIGEQLNTNTIIRPVKCFILSEAQAKCYCAQGEMIDAPTISSGEILHNECLLEYNKQTNHFSANFKNMQLTIIKRAEKKGTESVMDEKFALLFHLSVNLSANYQIRVWTLSLPVVVTVHGNQELQSLATITWDNACASIVREPFDVPDKISWRLLSEALYTKFSSTTGRALNEENMQFLYEKLFRIETMCNDNDYITWAQFCKEPMPDRTFTFWDWFFAAMKLTKEHLLDFWKAGLIFGFINKKRTDTILRMYSPGTFLIRFSDSQMGRVTVAFVNSNSEVYFLQQWNAKDLLARGLADRLSDFDCLSNLYPDIPKDTAFGSFYTIQPTTVGCDGYVPNSIKATIGVSSTNLIPTPMMQSPQQNNLLQDPSEPMIINEILNSLLDRNPEQ